MELGTRDELRGDEVWWSRLVAYSHFQHTATGSILIESGKVFRGGKTSAWRCPRVKNPFVCQVQRPIRCRSSNKLSLTGLLTQSPRVDGARVQRSATAWVRRPPTGLGQSRDEARNGEAMLRGPRFKNSPMISRHTFFDRLQWAIF